ncbi:MAG: hypothetical protein OXO49_02575 [Gammaproteobacteria bacterium]|nr:hypothetical protein [Gammaproteobacteria bacterium]MDE0251388.1 hypothetical protein [Gammaproteobacteria bacterium]MDE0401929.1 hypothetical protein [Gammaproteobacteria bacterium]
MKQIVRYLISGLSSFALIASLSVQAEIEGTYELEDTEESRFKWQRPTLTIKLSQEGEYSATLTKNSGEVLLNTDVVEVEKNEFKATFTTTTSLGDLDFTFAGQVNDGKLFGTISESMFSTEVKLAGKLLVEEVIHNPNDNEVEDEAQSTVHGTMESQLINPEIVGTYVLDSKSNSWKKPELKIDLDHEGNYSATLIAGKVTETDDIEGKGNSFKATFTISTNMGEMDISYAGRVEHGKLSGTITESMFGTEVELVGKLTQNENID